ncbi:MAG TPA: adenylate kinase [Thermoplasmata archaeon]|nr:adenylate kinase [Thermoplasmata archaeon]
MVRVVFLGPPGAGKGTQAQRLARSLGVRHLSTGDILRTAIHAQTPLGKEAEQFVQAGQLVPDDLVLRLLKEILNHPSTKTGYLLDGFPRNKAQAEVLESIAPVDRAVYFDIPESILVQRLTQRRTCPTCGTSYNLVTQPPKAPGLCDRDGSTLGQRPDDRPEAVRTRLEVYREQTAPLLSFYEERGRLRRVDASGAVDTVAQRVRAAVA